jgi:ABC-2 type transport system ATP-binding protein
MPGFETPDFPRTTMDQPILTIRNLSHRYRDRDALRDVTFQVNKGEVFGLLGPNGSGKTTLFRIVSTLLRPVTGSVTMFGHDIVGGRDAVRHQLGVVFQSPALDKKLSVYENLRHHGHLYNMTGMMLESRIQEMLERFALTDRTRDRVETLSGGLRRRVDLAKGLLHKPELLLLDEPSTGLDPLARRELTDYLLDLRDRDGLTVILTTHLMDEADRCDRLGVMDDGRLVAIDSPSRLKEQIGGDVISAETSQPEQLRDQIRQKFGLEATILNNQVRVERERGHQFITDLVEAFPGQIDAVSLGKPTLEDVFIHLTGHRLDGG